MKKFFETYRVEVVYLIIMVLGTALLLMHYPNPYPGFIMIFLGVTFYLIASFRSPEKRKMTELKAETERQKALIRLLHLENLRAAERVTALRSRDLFLSGIIQERDELIEFLLEEINLLRNPEEYDAVIQAEIDRIKS